MEMKRIFFVQYQDINPELKVRLMIDHEETYNDMAFFTSIDEALNSLTHLKQDGIIITGNVFQKTDDGVVFATKAKEMRPDIQVYLFTTWPPQNAPQGLFNGSIDKKGELFAIVKEIEKIAA